MTRRHFITLLGGAPKAQIRQGKDRASSLSAALSLSLSLYLPRRVMRDVYCSIAAWASQRGHRYAGKWLTPSDPLILAGAASDDMGATVHLRLRLVEVARIKGRENLVTVAVGQHASAVNVFLVARRHAQRGASR